MFHSVVADSSLNASEIKKNISGDQTKILAECGCGQKRGRLLPRALRIWQLLWLPVGVSDTESTAAE